MDQNEMKLGNMIHVHMKQQLSSNQHSPNCKDYDNV